MVLFKKLFYCLAEYISSLTHCGLVCIVEILPKYKKKKTQKPAKKTQAQNFTKTS